MQTEPSADEMNQESKPLRERAFPRLPNGMWPGLVVPESLPTSFTSSFDMSILLAATEAAVAKKRVKSSLADLDEMYARFRADDEMVTRLNWKDFVAVPLIRTGSSGPLGLLTTIKIPFVIPFQSRKLLFSSKSPRRTVLGSEFQRPNPIQVSQFENKRIELSIWYSQWLDSLDRYSPKFLPNETLVQQTGQFDWASQDYLISLPAIEARFCYNGCEKSAFERELEQIQERCQRLFSHLGKEFFEALHALIQARNEYREAISKVRHLHRLVSTSYTCPLMQFSCTSLRRFRAMWRGAVAQVCFLETKFSDCGSALSGLFTLSDRLPTTLRAESCGPAF